MALCCGLCFRVVRCLVCWYSFCSFLQQEPCGPFFRLCVPLPLGGRLLWAIHGPWGGHPPAGLAAFGGLAASAARLFRRSGGWSAWSLGWYMSAPPILWSTQWLFLSSWGWELHLQAVLIGIALAARRLFFADFGAGIVAQSSVLTQLNSRQHHSFSAE